MDLKSYQKLRDKIKIFKKFIEFFSRKAAFLYTVHMLVHEKELHSQKPEVRLPAACGAQTVNDESVKVLNFLFFIYFTWKREETFKKLQLFTVRPKQCFYLTNGIPEYFEKAANNSESKLAFSESSFNFLQKRLVLCTLYPCG